MATFSSRPVGIAYFLFVVMGVVALLTAGGLLTAAVQGRVLPALVAALAVLGVWEYRLRR